MREDNMNCTVNKNQPEVILDFCAGSLEENRRTEFARHIESCAECSAVVAAQREVWASLDRLPAPEISADFDARLYARIAQADSAPAWRRWLNRILHPPLPVAPWKPALSAVAAVAVITIGVISYAPRNAVQPPATPVQQVQSIDSAAQVDIEQVANALDELDVLMPAPKSVM